jgi:exodeoxyribonuclease VII small subunit
MSKNETFEQKMARLQTILDWFESNDATVTDSAKYFEQGLELIESLEKELSQTEQKIEQIKNKFVSAE